MKQLNVIAAAVLLAAGLAGAGAASAAMSEAPKHKAPFHGEVATRNAKAPSVSEQAARRIAWRSGIDHIEEIVLSGEHWEIAGRDRAGKEKALDIHAHDGSILNW